MKALLTGSIVEVIVDASIMNVVLLGREVENYITRHLKPIRTIDCKPDPSVNGGAVLAWSDTYKEFVVAPTKAVAAHPKCFTHWLPRAAVPNYQKAAA